MIGLLDESSAIIEETLVEIVHDAAMSSAADKAEHYEITTYGTVRVYADTLGKTKTVLLFAKTIEEEKNAHGRLM